VPLFLCSELARGVCPILTFRWDASRAADNASVHDRCFQCRFLCGHALAACGHEPECGNTGLCVRNAPEADWTELASRASRHLLSEYAVVGLTEAYDTTWTVLAARLPRFFGPPFDWRQSRSDPHVNEQHRTPPNASTAALLRVLLVDEVALYGRVARRLACQVKRCGAR